MRRYFLFDASLLYASTMIDKFDMSRLRMCGACVRILLIIAYQLLVCDQLFVLILGVQVGSGGRGIRAALPIDKMADHAILVL